MSCDECDEIQKLHSDTSGYYYRWGTANILVLGCKEHVKEMFEYLNKRFEED